MDRYDTLTALEQWFAEAGLAVTEVYAGPAEDCPLCRSAPTALAA